MDRYLVDKLIPGNKVNLTGIYTINEKKYLTNTGSAKQLKMPYIYVLGYTNDSVSGRNTNPLFTHDEEQRFREMSQDKEIYNKIINSVAPSIYGHQNIKKSIACLLFGGSTKHLPDKTKLRGDINVLLIRFDRLTGELLFRLQLTGLGPGQIRIGSRFQPQPLQPVPVKGGFEVAHRLHHRHVARHLEHGGEIDHAIGLAVVVEDRPTADLQLPHIIHRSFRLNHPLL